MDSTDTDNATLETQLPDLTNTTIDQILTNPTPLQPFLEDLLRQVERPRINLGSGPPGRAD